MRRLAIALLFAGVLPAQEFRGTFSGTVTDAQGAAVAKAKIVATETRTGAKSDTVSEASGAYTIPFLAPNTYRVTVNAAGFKSSVHEGVVVAANERVGVDALLQVGQNTDTVTVDVTGRELSIRVCRAQVSQYPSVAAREVQETDDRLLTHRGHREHWRRRTDHGRGERAQGAQAEDQDLGRGAGDGRADVAFLVGGSAAGIQGVAGVLRRWGGRPERLPADVGTNETDS